LTALGHSEDGWITLFPAGGAIPDTSNLNFDTDQYAVSNLVVVPLGDGGQVCAVGQDGTQVIVDVVGYLESVSPAPGLSCPRAHTLESLLVCIVDQPGMRDRSGVYVIPTDAERADFAAAARAMLEGSCGDIALGRTLAGGYRLASFTDVSTTRR